MATSKPKLLPRPRANICIIRKVPSRKVIKRPHQRGGAASVACGECLILLLTRPHFLLPSLCHQTYNIAISTRKGSPSHHRTLERPPDCHAKLADCDRRPAPACGTSGPTQMTALLLHLPRSVLPYRHLTVLQVDVLGVFRHEPAGSVASACMVETIDISPGLQVITTPR